MPLAENDVAVATNTISTARQDGHRV